MTLTIELIESEAARLRALAAAKGTDAETALHQLIAALPEEAPAVAGKRRQRAFGKYAGMGISVDEFIAAKRVETACEDCAR
jgi:hypothetical protein